MMDQKKKNTIYLIVLLLLILSSVSLAYFKRETGSIDFEPKKFTLEENTVITTVVLEGTEINNQLEYENGAWNLNDKYALDQGMRDVFFAVISQVEVLRPVSESMQDSLADIVRSKGLKVSILNNQDTILKYKVYGNDETQRTYFMDPEENEPYLVHIPGYKSYVGGIYKVKEQDWRNRFIWDVNWTSMKSLRIDYQDPVQTDLNFVFEQDFVTIENIAPLDTARMLGYLEEMAFLQATEFISKNSLNADSILSSQPEVIFTLEEIGNRVMEIKLYRGNTASDTWIGVINDEEWALFESDMVESLLRSPNYFTRGVRE